MGLHAAGLLKDWSYLR